MTLIADAGMERRCRDLVTTLDLPSPCTLDDLVSAVASRQEQGIQMLPLPPAASVEVSGLVMHTTTGYLVCYPHGADPWWQLMCASHELAHILCGHLPEREQSITATNPVTTEGADRDERAGTAGSAGTEESARLDLLNTYLPDMQDALRAWGRLYRCQMHGQVELEAELIATLLVQHIERGERAPADGAAPGDAAVLGRWQQVLGTRGQRRQQLTREGSSPLRRRGDRSSDRSSDRAGKPSDRHP